MRTSLRRRGANAIEFALTVPVFIMLVSGILDWSWFAYHRSILKAAVNKGCRTGSLVDPGMDNSKIASVIITAENATLANVDLLGGGFGACSDGCDVDIDIEGYPPTRMIKCRITGTYSPIWGMYVSDIGISASDLDRLAWQRWPPDAT